MTKGWCVAAKKSSRALAAILIVDMRRESTRLNWLRSMADADTPKVAVGGLAQNHQAMKVIMFFNVEGKSDEKFGSWGALMSTAKKPQWSTPQTLFNKLDAEFNFTVDVCANEQNRKCATYFGLEVDGLKQNWATGRCWMNPPYGKEISEWMRKAYESALNGALVVALVPNRSNAPWWHDYVMKADEIRFIRKKVPFTGGKKGVPFWGSVIVVFRRGTRQKPKVSSWEQPKRAVQFTSPEAQ